MILVMKVLVRSKYKIDIRGFQIIHSVQSQNRMNQSFILKILILISSFVALSLQQNTNATQPTGSKGLIQARKLFLFDSASGFSNNSFDTAFPFIFQRQFQSIPRIGLAIYTLDFQYSPQFKSQTFDTNRSGSKIKVSTPSTNIFNQIYIMYFATDLQQIGIFNTETLFTDTLAERVQNRSVSQTFNFNFKQRYINQNNIRLSVYLTGITMTSQLTNNGFPNNYTRFALRAQVNSVSNYSLIVSKSGFVEIQSIVCTFIYFETRESVLQNTIYQIEDGRGLNLGDSGSLTLTNFGGQQIAVQRQRTFPSLANIPINSSQPNSNRYENLQFFFGISQIECQGGQSIRLLGVQKYSNTIGQQRRLLLVMQTWRLTFIVRGSFNFLLFKSLKCELAGSNCDNRCQTSIRPHFTPPGTNTCEFCHISCKSCNVTQRNDFCDTCDQTTTKINNLCECKPEFWLQDPNSFICQSCFPVCKTCTRLNFCQTCFEGMRLNPVTSRCDCGVGTYFPITADDKPTKQMPCRSCQPNCLYCTGIGKCQAAAFQYYLSNGIVFPICRPNQQYVIENSVNGRGKCSQVQDLATEIFETKGRLSYEWEYRTESSNSNDILISLRFSQTDCKYYYQENGTSYSLQNFNESTGQTSTVSEQSAFFYDDGRQNIGGYGQSRTSSKQVIQTTNGVSSKRFGEQGFVDPTILTGQYYGLGQIRFFRQLYTDKSPENTYRNEFGIPYGKVRLQNQPKLANPNFIDALKRNIVFKIDQQEIPFTIQNKKGRNNEFEMIARPTKSFLGSKGSVEFRNTALIRSNGTALQVGKITKNIDRFDFYPISELDAARDIRNGNSIIVGILWGFSKYLLFVGLGWQVIPLMLVLEYIHTFNYLDAKIPINLDLFLTSFRDYRNPSILYPPLRDQFDAAVVNHRQIYRQIPQFQQFDRGLDFSKNTWQFFFTPLCSFALLFALAAINFFILNKLCLVDIPFISMYLWPRFFLHVGAYTLIQALPIAFFFCAQLKDITYSHPNQPNGAYPTFNIVLAFFSFFLTFMVPIFLLGWLFYFFNYASRISKFTTAKKFSQALFKQVDGQPSKNKSHYQDAIWGGNTKKVASYVTGASIFFVSILFGLFAACFITEFPWQIAGLVTTLAIFFGFIAFSRHFDNRVFKFFFMGLTGLLIAYLLIHAGVGSNRALGTTDQLNVGYLGIGILYAVIIAAIIFCIYLIYLTISFIFKNFIKNGKYIRRLKNDEQPSENSEIKPSARAQQVRLQTLRNRTIGRSINGVQNVNDGNPVTEDRLIHRTSLGANPHDNFGQTYEQPDANHQVLRFLSAGQDGYKYQSRPSGMIFSFPMSIGRNLQNKNLYIDPITKKIYENGVPIIDGSDYLPHIVGKNDQSDDQDKLQIKNIVSKKDQINQIVYQGQNYLVESKGDLRVKLRNMNTGIIKEIGIQQFQELQRQRKGLQQPNTVIFSTAKISRDKQFSSNESQSQNMERGAKKLKAHDPQVHQQILIQHHDERPANTLNRINQGNTTYKSKSYKDAGNSGYLNIQSSQNLPIRQNNREVSRVSSKVIEMSSYQPRKQYEINNVTYVFSGYDQISKKYKFKSFGSQPEILLDHEQYINFMKNPARRLNYNLNTKRVSQSSNEGQDNELMIQSIQDTNNFARRNKIKTQVKKEEGDTIQYLTNNRYQINQPNYQNRQVRYQSRKQVFQSGTLSSKKEQSMDSEIESVNEESICRQGKFYDIVILPSDYDVQGKGYDYQEKDQLAVIYRVEGPFVYDEIDNASEKFPKAIALLKNLDDIQQRIFIQ